MKTYTFIARISNSSVIEVEAKNYADALSSAICEFHESEIIYDLCNPKDMQFSVLPHL